MNNNQNNKIGFGIGWIAVGLILGMFIIPMMRSNSVVSNNIQNTSSKTVNVGGVDQHFIEQMIPHHDGAIAMANMAFVKSNRTEVKTLAKEIIDAQEREIKDMQGWYKNWFGKDVNTQNTFSMMNGGGMMSGGGMHMGGKEDVTALENAADFDKAFIEGMIPHHQLAIMMAQMLKSGTNRPEMLTLANNIIESQSEEITKMQGWYKSWYK
ncbi:MAG: DUF305 domain-containing protein [Candidatus Pacebacteria bacterium]|nr:DUF305 domain-containing protein [Candidatus Paceibacterota bacterium]